MKSKHLLCVHRLIGILIATVTTGCGGSSNEASQTDSAPKGRNPKWATPLQREGLPNLHQVAPNIYRGAQPTPEGFASLNAMGVKTIINFRRFHSDEDEIKQAGLEGAFQTIEIPINTWDMTDEHAARFLQIVEDKQNHPVFYHCQHGADRTGTMTAVYRIAHQGWTKKEAVDEMVDGELGYHAIWTNLIKYLEGFDTARIRSAVHSPSEP